MTLRKQITKDGSQLTVAVFADGQNVNLFRHSLAILRFIDSLSEAPFLHVYNCWRSISHKKQRKLQSQCWRCIDVLGETKNDLDNCLIKDVSNLCRVWIPDVLVLVANDGDFAPMVRSYLKTGRKVIVIGNKGKVSKRLQNLLSAKDIYFVEDLYCDLSMAA